MPTFPSSNTTYYTSADKAAVATIDNKVNKIVGKQLSTNDFTTTEKNKVSKLADNYASDKILQTDAQGNISTSDKSTSNFTSKNVITFDVLDAVFYSELGLPTLQSFTIPTGGEYYGLPDIFNDVLGHSTVPTLRLNDDDTKIYTVERALTAQNWVDIDTHGASLVGMARLDADNGSAGFFIGLQDHVRGQRYGATFNVDSNMLRITSGDSAFTDFTVNINPYEYFTYEVKIPPNNGVGQVYINDVLQATTIPFARNLGGGGTKITLSSGASAGSNRISYHRYFGCSIPREPFTKTITNADLQFDNVTLITPKHRNDVIFQIAQDVQGRAVGSTIEFVVRNIGGSISLTNLANPSKLLINDFSNMTIPVDEQKVLTAVNTEQNSNVYTVDLSSTV